MPSFCLSDPRHPHPRARGPALTCGPHPIDICPPARHYRLDIHAATAADAIRAAGGWLVDRALAGWDITATLTDIDPASAPALAILGVSLGPHTPTSNPDSHYPYGIAVLSGLYEESSEMRHYLHHTARHVREFSVFGPSHPPAGAGTDLLRPVRHQLSTAARAFKAAALTAAAAHPFAVDPFEDLHSTSSHNAASPSHSGQPAALAPAAITGPGITQTGREAT